MAQTAEQRRLIRLAGQMNRKAESLGIPGRVTPEELFSIELSQTHCAYCGIGLGIGAGTFDHVVPLDKGGRNRFSNIVRACVRCNREKYTKSPQELADYRQLVVHCARPGCPNEYRPRYSEWTAGRGRTCSRSCAARMRWKTASGA